MILRCVLPMMFVLVGCQRTGQPVGSTATPEAVPTIAEPVDRRRPIDTGPTPFNPRNVVFSPDPGLGRRPDVKLIELPKIPAARCVWGSTGRDHRGHILIGLSTETAEYLSAHLIDYEPDTGRTTDLGGVVENLTRLSLRRAKENQMKIHTKIWQAPDGHLYFSSMDEEGENEDGSALPIYGSHMWRTRPGESDWEHLGEVREALIACALGGRYVYYLGYFGHVVYQLDTQSGKVANKVRVGAAGGHTTRNIIADDRGHVFVPRVRLGAKEVDLIEYDDTLTEIRAFPLPYYTPAPTTQAHGIVGVCALADGGQLFLTDRGRLYRLTPRATDTALTDLGWIHPAGECYCPTLFSLDGESVVYGVGHRTTRGVPRYEWLRFDLRTRTGTSEPINLPVPVPETRLVDLLVYGSQTRDDDGRMYVAGSYATQVGAASSPCVWQIALVAK